MDFYEEGWFLIDCAGRGCGGLIQEGYACSHELWGARECASPESLLPEA